MNLPSTELLYNYSIYFCFPVKTLLILCPVFEILRQSIYQTRVFAYSNGYCRFYLLEIEGEYVIFL